jgi:hypothetical protein
MDRKQTDLMSGLQTGAFWFEIIERTAVLLAVDAPILKALKMKASRGRTALRVQLKHSYAQGRNHALPN